MPYIPSIEMFLTEIENAIDSRLYYIALVLTLTVPDVCSALESENGRAHSTLYKNWCRKHLQQAFPSLTPEDCYSLRCGVIHQGRMGIPGRDFARVIFTFPDSGLNVFHNNVMNDALQFDAVRFCQSIISAARAWTFIAAENPIVRANADNLVQLRSNGMPPYIVGAPVIA